MRKFLPFLHLVLIIVNIADGLAQQKAMFTQYMFNGLAVNPAYSAMDQALNVTALGRQQWAGFKGAPNTQTLTAHTPVAGSSTSAGVMFMRDQIGEVIAENSVSVTLAQRVRIKDDTYLALGLLGGVGKFSAAYSNSGSESAFSDPVFNDENATRATFGFGLIMFSGKFYTGFSSPFFFYRNTGSSSGSSTAYRPHYLLQGGYLTDLGPDIKFKPNMLVKYVAGSPVQIDVNANFLFRETVWIGGSLRSLDSVDILAELQLSPSLQVGYSYDFTTTRMAQVEKGSHELMLSMRIAGKGSRTTLPRCYF